MWKSVCKALLSSLTLAMAFGQEAHFKVDSTEVRPSQKINAFWPVPKEGCPKGFYRVGQAFFTGLEFQDACWNENLNQVQEDGRPAKEKKLKKRKAGFWFPGLALFFYIGIIVR